MVASLLISVVAAVAYPLALRRLRRLEEAAETTPWWFGYARDGVNLVASLLFVTGLALAGYDGPGALVLGLALLFVDNGLDWLLGKRLRWQDAHLALVPLVAGTALALALLRPRLAPALTALLAFAAPRS